jgi:hypothetical protein
MHNHRLQASVSVFRGDTAVRLYFTFTQGAVPYTIEPGCTAILSGTKGDGTTLWNRCAIESENVVRYDFTEQTATATGVINCEITLYDAEGKVITAPKFMIVVDEREVNLPELEQSTNEVDALAAILSTEPARVSAEDTRKINEATRVYQETQRQLAETARAEAENERDAKLDQQLGEVATILESIIKADHDYIGELEKHRYENAVLCIAKINSMRLGVEH